MADREHYFANDMMRFVGRRCYLNWAPPEELHASSPFTAITARVVEKYLQSNDATIIRRYCDDLHGAITDMQKFKALTFECFLKGYAELGKEEELFYSCMYVARLASILFTEGVRNAPESAIQVIRDVLLLYNRKFDADIFQRFRAICLDISA